MRTFLSVLKNDYLRTVPRITTLTVITAIALASILFSVYFTGTQQIKGHIALISQDPSAIPAQSSRYLAVSVFPEKPPRSALVEQKYDAYVTVDGGGNFHIETFRNSEFKNMLLLLLKNPDAQVSGGEMERGAGVNIIGFMMMFLLMISFSNLFAFADDKEQGQLHRIAAAPASFGGYLAAHCVYCLSMLLPEYVLLVVLKLRGWDIGFSLLQFAGLMTTLGFLGISLALLLNTLIRKPDNATMLGNSITVLTTILSGSFYSFSKNNSLFDIIVKLLPQKELMNFAQYMQNGSAGQHDGPILYTVSFSLVLFTFSYAILRRSYVKQV